MSPARIASALFGSRIFPDLSFTIYFPSLSFETSKVFDAVLALLTINLATSWEHPAQVASPTLRLRFLNLASSSFDAVFESFLYCNRSLSWISFWISARLFFRYSSFFQIILWARSLDKASHLCSAALFVDSSNERSTTPDATKGCLDTKYLFKTLSTSRPFIEYRFLMLPFPYSLRIQFVKVEPSLLIKSSIRFLW